MATTADADLDGFLEAMAPRPDSIQREMAERADRDGFPIVGPVVGGLLHQLTLATRAERVFEFGSGFGYSAYWIARALGEGDCVVLTEEDPDELAAAEAFFERGGYADRAQFEAGDAMDAIDAAVGPFDLVLIDHDKERYLDAFEAVRADLTPGGVIVADNAIRAGPMDTAGLVAAFVDGATVELDATTEGIRRYLAAVRDDDAFATTVLPIGSGIAVSVRRPG
ncbi:MAG: O-methyltransferase [Halobacteriales archaeon]